MRIVDAVAEETRDGVRLAGTVVWERRDAAEAVEIVYRDTSVGELTAEPAAPLIAAMLVPAMAAGEDIASERPVSGDLVRGFERTVEANLRWHPSWHAASIAAPEPDARPTPGREIAAFFSGGVDSFYTLFGQRPEPITVLLTAIGMDVRFEKRAHAEPVMAKLTEIGRALGVRQVVVDTNLYEVGHRYVTRAEHHGAVLGAIALGLAGTVRRAFVPLNLPIRSPTPWGSHSHAEEGWSTETFELRNDGDGVDRFEKIRAIAGEPLAMSCLRVCLRRPDRYNCGRCDKCVSTALALELVGAIDRCATLERVSPGIVGRTRIGLAYEGVFEDLRARTSDRTTRTAIALALARSRLERPVLERVRRRRLHVRLRRWSRA